MRELPPLQPLFEACDSRKRRNDCLPDPRLFLFQCLARNTCDASLQERLMYKYM
ncbi:hypothetical protein M405DRAFT_807895 [Rhizopogon salebrosus TDB-379]|nr:hypothetical protein M405DRAFT_807895 [Rhizopogon salebrosus TDB-379]